MKKKALVVSVLLGILLISIVSAGLLDYFGKITGSVVVSGPVFYAVGNYSNEDLKTYVLSTNNFWDGEESYIKFENGGENIWFVSAPLSVESFYDADFNFKINVCAKNNTVNDTIGQITMSLKILKEDGDLRETVCELYINNVQTEKTCYSSDYTLHEISCNKKIEGLDETDRFAWIMTDGEHDIEYRIRTKGETKFTITPTQ